MGENYQDCFIIAIEEKYQKLTGMIFLSEVITYRKSIGPKTQGLHLSSPGKIHETLWNLLRKRCDMSGILL